MQHSMAIGTNQGYIFYARSATCLEFCNRLFMMGFNKAAPTFSIALYKTKATYLASEHCVLFLDQWL